MSGLAGAATAIGPRRHSARASVIEHPAPSGEPCLARAAGPPGRLIDAPPAEQRASTIANTPSAGLSAVGCDARPGLILTVGHGTFRSVGHGNRQLTALARQASSV